MSENGTIPSKVVFNGFQFLLEKDLDWLFFTPFIPKRDASNDSLLEGYEIVDPVEEHDAGGTVKSKENEND